MQSNVVFTETLNLYDEPFTTAEMIERYSGVKRRSINKIITTNKSDLEEFGVLRFQIAKPMKELNRIERETTIL